MSIVCKVILVAFVIYLVFRFINRHYLHNYPVNGLNLDKLICLNLQKSFLPDRRSDIINPKEWLLKKEIVKYADANSNEYQIDYTRLIDELQAQLLLIGRLLIVDNNITIANEHKMCESDKSLVLGVVNTLESFATRRDRHGNSLLSED
ncbi:hypothetical protein, partial [Cysteiniphilum sp. SYW-8]|uniref:hypothetical protein n=1 Tax=Cysteiniphilum sp. SYW-8 TaxID=2610890 RepID=UPI00123D8D56